MAGENLGLGYCADHHIGPYCAGCEEGFAMVDFKCVDCSILSGTNKSLAVVIFGLVLLVIFIVLNVKLPSVRAAIGRLNTRPMITKVKCLQ